MESKPQRRKIYLATLLLLMLTATIVLAISIQSIEFNPARGAPPAYNLFEGEGEVVPELPSLAGETGQAVEMKAPDITLFAIIFMVSGLFIVMLTREGRQEMFLSMLRALIIGVALYLLAPRITEILNGLLGGFGQGQDAAAPPPVPPMPTFFQVLASLPFAILLTFVGWRLYQRFKPRTTPIKSNFLGEVQASLDELDAGGDLRSTILGCYRAMIAQAQRERLIVNDQLATTLELEQKLVGYGLPAKETSRLTRLFEDVRYGVHQASERERLEARDCLVAFINACEDQFGQKDKEKLPVVGN